MDKQDLKNLKKRYLIWLFMITKEAFDRYERKFTQLEIDEFILKEMERELKGAYLPHEKKALEKSIDSYRKYIDEKEKYSLTLKYKGKVINPDFLFLDVKLEAVEKAILEEFGAKVLAEIKETYEEVMTEKILTGTRHK